MAFSFFLRLLSNLNLLVAEDAELIVVVSDLRAEAVRVEHVVRVASATHYLRPVSQSIDFEADSTVEAAPRLKEKASQRQFADANGNPCVLTGVLLGASDVEESASHDEQVGDQNKHCLVDGVAQHPAQVAVRVVRDLQLSLLKVSVGVKAVHNDGVEAHDGVKHDDGSDQHHAPVVRLEVAPGVGVARARRFKNSLYRAGRHGEVGSRVHDAGPDDE